MDTSKIPTIEEIISALQSYQPDAPVDLVRRAYEFAKVAHGTQKRQSGLEYITHPLCVAEILTTLHIDAITISAAFLHDVAEDTKITLDEIAEEFSPEIASLVDGVTKLSRLKFKSKEEQQVESFRKMFLAMAKDIRVVLIKLADRLHNMRTLKAVEPEKQHRVAKETLDIFAPLANRLGISNIKCELEDLCLRYMEPERYYELVRDVKQKRNERKELIDESIQTLEDKLKSAGIKCDIHGRPKHFFSIYRKMVKKNKTLNEIYDLLAIRVLVDNISDCYAVLGTIHAMWKPIPKRFKDYIAVPKSNMYQSLHTTVIGMHGQPLEIQIRTYEMHRVSEYGIAAHWKYKEGNKGGGKGLEEKMSWLRQLIEWQKEIRDPKEFVEAVKLDVFADEVFVFTPRGDVVDLPAGSIPLDFAYRIHTDVGHHCVGAKVNGKIVPLEYRLTNGDIVEIITNKQSAGPSRDWLNIVGASETRNKIRSWFKKECREENIVKGKELLEKESKKLGYDFKVLTKSDRLTKVAQKMAAGTADDVLATVGFGGMTAKGIISKLLEFYKKEIQQETPTDVSEMLASLKPRSKKNSSSHGVLVEGEAGVMVRLAKCCNPIPGDMIVGYITRGRGVSVHRADCPNIKLDTSAYERMIDVGWDITTDTLYKVSIEVNCGDRAGVMAEVMTVPSEMKINISSINARTHKNNTATIVIELEIANNTQIETVMTKLRRLKDVYSVYRAIPSQKG